MKLEFKTKEKAMEIALPAPGSAFAVVEIDCPNCGEEGPIKVAGTTQVEEGRQIKSQAQARCCGRPVGELVLTEDSLWGIEEDRAVLEGRARVYDGN